MRDDTVTGDEMRNKRDERNERREGQGTSDERREDER